MRITRPFYLGMFEVTQRESQELMGTNPSNFKDESGRLPVEQVSWEDAQEFCRKLSARAEENRAGRQYRLPTEAEWEYACRAGTTPPYGAAGSSADLGDYAWYSSNSGSKTHPVGQKKPNAWGLYDMQGDVYEWCSDWRESYGSSPVDDPRGPTAGSHRVLRGGSWDFDARYCRPASRNADVPGSRYVFFGFRVAFSSVEQGK